MTNRKEFLKAFGLGALAVLLLAWLLNKCGVFDPPEPGPVARVPKVMTKVRVQVEPTKADGGDWDLDGSSPDLGFCMDDGVTRSCGAGLYVAGDDVACKDSLACARSVLISPTGTDVLFEVWDEDAFGARESVGVGRCAFNAPCIIGRATVRLVRDGDSVPPQSYEGVPVPELFRGRYALEAEGVPARTLSVTAAGLVVQGTGAGGLVSLVGRSLDARSFIVESGAYSGTDSVGHGVRTTASGAPACSGSLEKTADGLLVTLTGTGGCVGLLSGAYRVAPAEPPVIGLPEAEPVPEKWKGVVSRLAGIWHVVRAPGASEDTGDRALESLTCRVRFSIASEDRVAGKLALTAGHCRWCFGFHDPVPMPFTMSDFSGDEANLNVPQGSSFRTIRVALSPDGFTVPVGERGLNACDLTKPE